MKWIADYDKTREEYRIKDTENFSFCELTKERDLSNIENLINFEFGEKSKIVGDCLIFSYNLTSIGQSDLEKHFDYGAKLKEMFGLDDFLEEDTEENEVRNEKMASEIEKSFPVIRKIFIPDGVELLEDNCFF